MLCVECVDVRHCIRYDGDGWGEDVWERLTRDTGCLLNKSKPTVYSMCVSKTNASKTFKNQIRLTTECEEMKITVWNYAKDVYGPSTPVKDCHPAIQSKHQSHSLSAPSTSCMAKRANKLAAATVTPVCGSI